MTDTTIGDDGLALTPDRLTPILFAVAIFTSASLVFVVQPMVTKLVLPILGGSPSVWNTSMVFFQTALLAGYGYAHLLQRVGSIRTQVLIHLSLLLVAALFLPLHINGWLGEPDPSAPIGWMLGTLALSIGAPFAVLSATAPLLQAWYARVRAGYPDGQNPYVLYAASNLGSFLALLAYPLVIEPLATLSGQRWGWSGGYVAFLLMVVALALLVWRRRLTTADAPTLAVSPSIPWREKIIWVLLAAGPSSLMLGVTAHLATDVASAPFLWVVPLALYLLTFVIAFQARPWIPINVTLVIAAALGAVVAIVAAFRSTEWPIAFAINIGAFFFLTLMCHQRLAQRRPAPDRLTEFYLLMSLGGVVGGAFNALVAPVVFNMVWEYPLVLAIIGLARPWGRGKLPISHIIVLLFAIVACLVPHLIGSIIRSQPGAWAWFSAHSPFTEAQVAQIVLGAAAICAFWVRDRALAYVAIVVMITLSAQHVARGYAWDYSGRSFFGVMRVATTKDDRMGGDVHVLMHGTTLHGAQARNPAFDCIPNLYYNPDTPIGGATEAVLARGPARIGVIGQGSGAMAAYKRAEDRMTFFEIDPMMDRVSRDPRWFTYISDCAVGDIDTVLGDARLTFEKQPAGSYDLLIVDAFSSDSVPTHLLTQEAIRMYLSKLKPNGVVLLHLSNRNLDITLPTVAAAQALGVPYRHSIYIEDGTLPDMQIASTEALVLSPTPQGLADLDGHGDWTTPLPTRVRPWTDDYVNLFGSMWRHMFPPPERPL
ncbi:spermidine synthase [Brevundimonas sp. NPDC092305]|uniref:spermidine synthase n=1 Tax=Brevundimonas sp. NPDC092305 TaxID=3363957 RepID=UPI0037FA43C6